MYCFFRFNSYDCQKNKCVKTESEMQNYSLAVSWQVCRLFCGNTIGNLWPQPRGLVRLEHIVVQVNVNNIIFDFPKMAAPRKFWLINQERFLKQIKAKVPEKITYANDSRLILIKIVVYQNSENVRTIPGVTLDTDESYKLHIDLNKNNVFVNITSRSVFGARYGLETLSQLFVYDAIRNEVKVVAKAEIIDRPAYKYRGVLLDTSRNWYSIKAIKRTIGKKFYVLFFIKCRLFNLVLQIPWQW